MSDRYIPWWVPADHPARGVAVTFYPINKTPPDVDVEITPTVISTPPPTELSAAAQRTLIRLATAAPPGAFAEVGVYRGGAAWHLARIATKQSRALHLFDTFTGIPEAGPEDTTFPIGSFSETSEAAVRAAIPSATFHVGIFPDTMPGDLAQLAFVHCDCDQYRTTHEVIRRLGALLVPDGVMLFDDYDGVPGARQAVDEALGSTIELTPEGKAFWRKGGAE